MSYWSHHPEELEEITIEHLPHPYKRMVKSGATRLRHVPQDIREKAMDEGVANYWAEKGEQAHEKMEGARIDKAIQEEEVSQQPATKRDVDQIIDDYCEKRDQFIQTHSPGELKEEDEDEGIFGEP